MIIFILKFFISFFISFSILCIPIERRPIFEHLRSIVSPIASYVFQNLDKKLEGHWDKARKATHLLAPVSTDSTSRRRISVDKSVYEESYTNEEKEILRRALEEQQDKSY